MGSGWGQDGVSMGTLTGLLLFSIIMRNINSLIPSSSQGRSLEDIITVSGSSET